MPRKYKAADDVCQIHCTTIKHNRVHMSQIQSTADRAHACLHQTTKKPTRLSVETRTLQNSPPGRPAATSCCAAAAAWHTIPGSRRRPIAAVRRARPRRRTCAGAPGDPASMCGRRGTPTSGYSTAPRINQLAPRTRTHTYYLLCGGPGRPENHAARAYS